MVTPVFKPDFYIFSYKEQLSKTSINLRNFIERFLTKLAIKLDFNEMLKQQKMEPIT